MMKKQIKLGQKVYLSQECRSPYGSFIMPQYGIVKGREGDQVKVCWHYKDKHQATYSVHIENLEKA